MMHRLNRITGGRLSLALAIFIVSSGTIATPAVRATRPGLAAALQQKENGAVTQQGLAGNWLGTLEAGGAKLRLLLKIKVGADNSLQASLDSLDQGAMDLRVDSIVQTGQTIRAELKAIDAVFEGKLNPEGTEIAGSWKQGGGELPLTLRHVRELPAQRRPQEPQKPYPYTEEEVVYENRQDKVKLAATLTVPAGKGPFPAVVLITGSGPEDRNEAVYGHRPFLVLADYLTRRGVAVLRADDRGVGGSSAPGAADTSENYATDALSGVEFLKTRKEINPRQIGLIGHSEGGLIAPLAAVRSKDVAFIVLIAGPGVPGDQLLEQQALLILKAQGAPDALAEDNRRLQQLMISILKAEKTNAAAESRLRAELPRVMAEIPEERRKALGITEEALVKQFKSMTNAWFRNFVTYDPRPVLKQVRCPVLAVIGSLDLQVPARQNLPAISEALKAGGNKDHTVLELAGLNHLLQTARTGSPLEYAQIEETMSPKALELIADWIIKHTTQQQPSAK
jgi:uncharacterized protein